MWSRDSRLRVAGFTGSLQPATCNLRRNLLLFPLLNHLHEIREEIERVVRTGRRLGVILHGDDRLATVAEALQRLVVEIDVRELHVILTERVGIDGEAVIL